MTVAKAVKDYEDARESLAEVVFGHPNQDVRQAVATVDDSAFQLMKSTSLFVVSFSPGYRENLQDMLPEYRKDALAALAAFQTSIDEALALLHMY